MGWVRVNSLSAKQEIARVAVGAGENLAGIAEVDVEAGRHEERFGAESPDPSD